MRREERELARLLIEDPTVRGWVRRAAAWLLVVGIVAVLVGAIVLLLIGEA